MRWMNVNPRLLLTMGDVAGVGPEIIARAWPELVQLGRPVVVGDPDWMRRAVALCGGNSHVVVQERPGEVEPTAHVIPVLRATQVDLTSVRSGQVTAEGGRAAYDFLCAAIRLTLAGEADGIVTAPLHKEGLHLAGLKYPGHTEILAEKTGTREYAMMLYARGPNLPHGLGVVHVTLHCALRDVFAQLSTGAVLEKIRLLDGILRRLVSRAPRIAVAALNPHASDGGLFGSEERNIIAPAVQKAQEDGLNASGPWPADTLFVRARGGAYDGVVAMYHDEGHIALKLLGGFHAVNITVGLPIVRTSVAHGTAYDIAGKGIADPASMIEATRVAALLARSRAGESGVRSQERGAIFAAREG
jgi:4-hydroxythreonine-4-phosphate dehydrogenase